MAATTHTATPQDGATRRDFLYIATASLGAVGAAAVVWPFIDQMNPDKGTLAAGAPVDLDVSKIEPGQQVVVLWRGSPILVVNRPPEAVKTLKSNQLRERLSDPDSTVLQQPKYAANATRSIKPELAVLVGICTHLGCIPQFFPNPSPSDPVADWLGGYFCPCHGSKYDLAGRVYRGVPAPYNLPVPPYRMVDDKTLRIGENPTGQTFELSEIVQI